MKRILLLLLIASGSVCPAFATNAYDSIPRGMSDYDLGMYYLQKSKKLKTAAWISLAGGLALSIAGSAMYDNKWENGGSTTTAEVLMYGGSLIAVASVPLFIAGARNKGRAEILLRNEKIPLSMGNQPRGNLRSVSIAIPLGK